MKVTGIKKKGSGKIEIDREACKGCGYCIDACPKGGIGRDHQFNLQGYFPAVFTGSEKCTGCAICATVCPDIAIEVWREVKK